MQYLLFLSKLYNYAVVTNFFFTNFTYLPVFELKLLLQHFREQRQSKRLVFIEKYASKHVWKLRKLKQYAAVILIHVEQHKYPTVLVCLSFLWRQVFLREREKIFYTYSGPYRGLKRIPIGLNQICIFLFLQDLLVTYSKRGFCRVRKDKNDNNNYGKWIRKGKE